MNNKVCGCGMMIKMKKQVYLGNMEGLKLYKCQHCKTTVTFKTHESRRIIKEKKEAIKKKRQSQHNAELKAKANAA